MKPFDLEKALTGEDVVTRSGEAVSQLTLFDVKGETDCLMGVVGGADLVSWDKNGHYIADMTCAYDLFMAPKLETFWVAIRRYNFFGFAGAIDKHYPLSECAVSKEALIEIGYIEDIYSYHEITREIL